MKLRIIPAAKLTIKSSKSNEEIFASLEKALAHHNGSNTWFEGYADLFIIRRTLHNKSRTNIIANGTILNKGGNRSVYLDISANDNFLIFFAICGYAINLFFFIFMIVLSVKNHNFRIYYLFPILLGFIGYGFTTATVQGAIDELIGEVKKSIQMKDTKIIGTTERKLV